MTFRGTAYKTAIKPSCSVQYDCLYFILPLTLHFSAFPGYFTDEVTWLGNASNRPDSINHGPWFESPSKTVSGIATKFQIKELT